MAQVIKFPEPDDAMWAGIEREVVKNVGRHVDRELIDDAITWARAKWERLPAPPDLSFTLDPNSSGKAIQSQVQGIVNECQGHTTEPLAAYLVGIIIRLRIELLMLRKWGEPGA